MKLIPRAECREQWNPFVDAHPAGWWWHRAEWLDYCLAAKSGTDHSFAITDGNRLVGLCPLIQDGDQFQGDGNPLAMPLASIARGEEHVEVLDAMTKSVDAIAVEHRIRSGRWRFSPLACSVPMLLYELRGFKDISWTSQVLHLQQPLDVLWAGVKDGHRAEVHRGLRECDVRELEPYGAGIQQFRRVHRAVHGETRPDDTWRAMAEWANAREAMQVLAFRSDYDVVGGAYFILYKDAAYYASGAYLQEHTAHAVIWTAIRRLKLAGIQQLELGWLQGNLAIFKSGFGGHPKPVYAVEKRWT